MSDRLRATVLAVCTAALAATSPVGPLTAPLAAQDSGARRDAASVRSTERSLYLRSVGRVFRVAPDEAELLSSWLAHPAEVPVLLHVAKRAGVSPDVVGSLRKAGASWQRLTARLGLSAAAFYVEIGELQLDGVLARPLAAYRARPAGEWYVLALTDMEIVALVNVRVLAEAASVSPAEVAALLASPSPDYVSVYAGLLRSRVGRGPPIDARR